MLERKKSCRNCGDKITFNFENVCLFYRLTHIHRDACLFSTSTLDYLSYFIIVCKYPYRQTDSVGYRLALLQNEVWMNTERGNLRFQYYTMFVLHK